MEFLLFKVFPSTEALIIIIELGNSFVVAPLSINLIAANDSSPDEISSAFLIISPVFAIIGFVS